MIAARSLKLQTALKRDFGAPLLLISRRQRRSILLGVDGFLRAHSETTPICPRKPLSRILRQSADAFRAPCAQQLSSQGSQVSSVVWRIRNISERWPRKTLRTSLRLYPMRLTTCFIGTSLQFTVGKSSVRDQAAISPGGRVRDRRRSFRISGLAEMRSHQRR